MFKKCRNILRNEKGLTLIELLAVVVILGIIAAIAIPSIGSLIANSKEDAHKATAQQLMSAARLAVLSESDTLGEVSQITWSSLESYVEKIKESDYTTNDIIVYMDGNGKVAGVKLVLSDTAKSAKYYDAQGDVAEATDFTTTP